MRRYPSEDLTLSCESGAVRVAGRDLSDLISRQLARLHIARPLRHELASLI